MRQRCSGRRLACLLLALSLFAACLAAQPLLNLADTFSGIPFGRTGQVAFTADGAFLYTFETCPE